MKQDQGNKRKKAAGTGRRFGLAVLTFLMMLMITVTGLADPVEMKLGYGYRDIAKSGQLLPVTVSFENLSGETIEGFLSFEITGDSGTISYTSTVSIPQEGLKVKRVVTIPDAASEQSGDRIRVRLFDDSGNDITSSEMQVSYLGNGKEAFIGILSDEQPSLEYLGNLSITEQISTRTIMLNPADLPEEADGLNQLDLIVISGFDMSRLSPEVTDAITGWVEDGGILLLGTGANPQPLGGFKPYLGSCRLSGSIFTTVNMGMKYSKSGPDGASYVLAYRNIDWDGAQPVETEADRELIWRKYFEKGSICIAACDLCDLYEFAGEHPGFAQDLILAVLGQTGLSRISAGLSSSAERLSAAQTLVNTFHEEKLPSIRVYAVFAVLFVLAAGTGLFRILKNRGLGVYYMLGVLILSAGATLLCWLLSSSTRITRPFIDYGVITEYTGSELSDQNGADQPAQKASVKGFIDIESPNLSALTLELSQTCTVRPVSINGNISLTEGKKQMLAVTGQKQFEKNIFQVEEKMNLEAASSPLRVILESGESGVSGTVMNTGTNSFYGVALISRRSIVYIGDLAPSETVSFTGKDLIYGPMAIAPVTSGYLMQQGSFDYPDQKKSLIEYELGESVALEEGKVLLLGFVKEYTPDFLPSTKYMLHGSTLFVVEEEPVLPTDGCFEMYLGQNPAVLSGAYRTKENTILGNADTVLELSIGGEVQVDGLVRHEMNDALAGESVTAFKGQISMYNYTHGGFDLIDAGKKEWKAAELKNYLSPTNSLIIRYTPDEDASEIPMFLPVFSAAVRFKQQKLRSAPTL